MKKFLHIPLLLMLIFLSSDLMAQRFVSEVFTSTTVTSNVLYAWNYSTIPTDDDQAGHSIPMATLNNGMMFNDSLRADVYEPVGDTMLQRPTVIMLHTGSFLPIFYNQQTTGQRFDSTITEMCRQFARRGYTAIAIDYRKGWNPQASGAPGQEIRTGTLLQAAGRAIQDAKAAIRFFRNSALNGGNPYHIDERKIIMGGSGSGGYIALGCATVDGYDDISLSKFTASMPNAYYAFTPGDTYFDSTYWGTIEGDGGLSYLNNSNNTPGIGTNFSFAFNMGGALADSSWLMPGHIPMVCFHPSQDPFAPYNVGPVIVPTTGDFVIEAFGSYYVIQKADSLLNNGTFQFNTWTDPYTTRANQINDSLDGLFPFELPASPFPPFLNQAGPWEWWDSTTVYFICQNVLGFTLGHTDTILTNSWLTNTDMSSYKGRAYIDTIMGYLNPRISAALTLPTGVNNVSKENTVRLYPNPASDYFMIEGDRNGDRIKSVSLHDIAGRLVYHKGNLNSYKHEIRRNSLTSGIYFAKIRFNNTEIVRKISLQ